MLTNIIEGLKNTPIWVYILFAYLIFVGIKATKPRQVQLKQLLIMPILFTYFSIETLINNMQVTVLAVVILAISMMVGTALGWWQIHKLPIKVDKEKRIFEIPGSWSTLIIILIIFSSKYYFGYAMAIDPHVLENTGFEVAMLSISGICSGLFIGRLLNYLYRFNVSEHVSLKISKKR